MTDPCQVTSPLRPEWTRELTPINPLLFFLALALSLSTADTPAVVNNTPKNAVAAGKRLRRLRGRAHERSPQRATLRLRQSARPATVGGFLEISLSGHLADEIQPDKIARTMVKNFKSELVACFGQPVAENPTGEMQEAAFRAASLPWRYLTIEVAPADLPAAVTGARAMGWRGFNCTIPHKVAVIPLLDGLSREAELIGAVNTVRREGDRFIGENTDGKGFLRGVRQDAKVDPAGKRAVLLGAGGAARAIATELLLAGVADLLVVNRTPERGEAMTADLASRTGGPIRFAPWVGTFAVPPGTDLLINATSIGLYPDTEAMPAVDLDTAPAHCLVCDAVFNPPETRLLAAARARNLAVLDGLSMLVYQGVTGFQLWTGQSPDEGAMKAALRAALDV